MIIIDQAHNALIHKGRDATIEEIKKNYYWPIINETAVDYIKHCDTCNTNSEKTQGDEQFIQASYPMKK
jgi:hypothetical protein